VRFHKAAGDEERTAFVFPQILNRTVGCVIIAVAFAIAVEDDDAVGICRAVVVRWQRWQHTVRHGNLRARNRPRPSNWRTTTIVGRAAAVGGFAPRFRVVNSTVINLPRAHSDIAVFLEQLRQRRPVGMRGAKIGSIPQHARPGRMAAGEQRGARWIAERELAVISIEAHAGLGERVEIRRLRVKQTAITTQLDGAWLVAVRLRRKMRRGAGHRAKRRTAGTDHGLAAERTGGD
jgi:hypothetical protein